MAQDATSIFETHRGFLTGLAYRMLGSVAEAEDAVQDAWLRWNRTDRAGIDNVRAWLSTVVTRLSLDRLKAARHRRETYVGAWLPDPLIEDMATHPHETVDRDVSVALMLALERLSPLERAAFLLHDIFDMSYADVAATLGNGEDAARQLASRARKHLREARPRYVVTAEKSQPVVDAFLAASRSGDTAVLKDLLAADAVLLTDGGGIKPAALNPILGPDRIQRFFAGLARKRDGRMPLWRQAISINGLPGWAMVEVDGTLQTLALEIDDGHITAVYITRNPEKLRHVARQLPPEVRTLMSDSDPTEI
jgi:RNA polymerase sigma-70 factor (ECF subfamily)